MIHITTLNFIIVMVINLVNGIAIGARLRDMQNRRCEDQRRANQLWVKK